VEGLDGCFERFDVEAEVVFDLVVRVDVLVNRLELMLLLFVDAVEAFQLPVGLGMVDAAQEDLESRG